MAAKTAGWSALNVMKVCPITRHSLQIPSIHSFQMNMSNKSKRSENHPVSTFELMVMKLNFRLGTIKAVRQFSIQREHFILNTLNIEKGQDTHLKTQEKAGKRGRGASSWGIARARYTKLAKMHMEKKNQTSKLNRAQTRSQQGWSGKKHFKSSRTWTGSGYKEYSCFMWETQRQREHFLFCSSFHGINAYDLLPAIPSARRVFLSWCI